MTQPRCQHCQDSEWYHRPYGEELAWKQSRVHDCLSQVGLSVMPDIPSVIASPQESGYRATAKLAFGFDKATGQVLLGIYKPGTHEIVDLEWCSEHNPAMQPVIHRVKELVLELGLPVYNEIRHKGFLRYFFLRVLDEERMMAAFVTVHNEGEWQKKLLTMAKRLAAEFPTLRGIDQNMNPDRGNRILGYHSELLHGQLYSPVYFLEKAIPVSANSFMQVNLAQFKNILQLMRERLDAFRTEASLRVADIYAGTGAIGRSITRDTDSLMMIEGDRHTQSPMVEGARQDGRDEISAVGGMIEDSLISLELFEPEVAIVNPPRKGLASELIGDLKVLKPRLLMYLSCNPETLARDLKLLQSHFRIERVQPFDMMPRTEHVETLCVLELMD